MKLLTKEILKKLPKLYSQPAHDDLSQEMVFYVKLFTPDSNWTWYIAEYDPETEIAWGLVKGNEQEFGSFDMKEIKELRGPFGLPVERDICFETIKEKELLLKIRFHGLCDVLKTALQFFKDKFKPVQSSIVR